MLCFLVKTPTCTGVIGFAAVDVLNMPAPLAVALGGVLGALAHAVGAV